MITVVKINEANRLKEVFGNLFDRTNKDVMSAARYGVSNAINVLKERTMANMSSGGFNITSSVKYGVPLKEGLKAYMLKDTATGYVDVLGNTRSNDGTWRLRFFEVGAVRKKRGVITPRFFLATAASNIGSEASTMIENSVREAINKINNT